MKEYQVTIKYVEFFTINVDAKDTAEASEIALESAYRDQPPSTEYTEIKDILRVD